MTLLHRTCVMLALTSLLSRASSVNAAPADDAVNDDGVSLRLRAGVGLPTGESEGSRSLSSTYGVLIPLDLEGGYWVLPRLFVGAHGAFGVVTVADAACGAPLSCSATDIRFGAGVEYRFDLSGLFRKWLSAGAGWELTRFGIERAGSRAWRTDSGPEYLYLQFGGDFALDAHIGVGPFAGITLAEYRTATLHQGDGSEATYKIADTSLHEWVLFGVRGVWTL